MHKGKLSAVIAAVIVVGILVYQLATLWQPLQFGGYTVRRNRLTGMAEVREQNQWSRFADDPYADPVPAELLREVHLTNIAWGPGGLLCAQATNGGTKPIVGRVAFQIVLLRSQKYFRDRAIRATVNFPPGEARTIIIRTNLETPDPKITTRLRLQPAAYSGM